MFDEILVALDESQPACPLLCATMSVGHPRNSRVSVVSVRRVPAGSPGAPRRVVPEDGGPAQQAAERLRQAGYRAHASVRLVDHGNVAEELILAIEETAPDLVVMGSRGLNNLWSLVTASVSHQVLARVGCPVLIAREATDLEAPRRLLLAYDDSPHSRRAARVAAHLAHDCGAEVEVISVSRPPLTEPAFQQDAMKPARRVEALVHALRTDVIASGSVKVAAGGKADAIAEAAEEADADLIVMGTRGLSRIAGAVLGSVSREVVHLSHRKVLLVP